VRPWALISESYAAIHGIVRYKELLFWAVVFPILLYIIFISVLGGPRLVRTTIGVYDEDGSVGSGKLSRGLLSILNSSGAFKVKVFKSRSELLDAVRRGEAPLGLVIPANFTESIEEGSSARLELYVANTLWGLYSRLALKDALNEYSNAIRSYISNTAPPDCRSLAVEIARPISLDVVNVTPPLLATKAGERAYHAINMVGLESLFIGLYTGALTLNERKRSGTLKVILSSPMSGWELLVADMLGAATVAAVSAISVIGVSLVVGAKYMVSPSSLGVSILLGSASLLFTIGLGLLIAPLAKTPEGAGALVNAIGFPVMFAGGVIIPPSVLPGCLSNFASTWPLGKMLELLRSVLIYGRDPSAALKAAIPSLAITALLYLAGGLAYQRLLQRSLEEY
jgi:ABC-2 type transport system permease protein